MWETDFFVLIAGANLLFGLMETSTTEEVILVKHLGIALFLRGKTSLYKTLKFGALNKYKLLLQKVVPNLTWISAAQKALESNIMQLFLFAMPFKILCMAIKVPLHKTVFR